MVILDTSIIIDHLRRSARSQTLLTQLLETGTDLDIRIAIMTLQELYAGKSTRDETKEKDVAIVLSQFEILPYTYQIAKLAGEIERELTEPIDFADAAIAATAITQGALLYTLNTKHFVGIKGLEFYKPS